MAISPLQVALARVTTPEPFRDAREFACVPARFRVVDAPLAAMNSSSASSRISMSSCRVSTMRRRFLEVPVFVAPPVVDSC